MKRDLRQAAPRRTASSPEVIGVARIAFDGPEDEGVVGEATGAERNAQFELSLTMLAQHRDRGGGQGDQPASVRGLRRFDPGQADEKLNLS